jgi:hypothetical protein
MDTTTTKYCKRCKKDVTWHIDRVVHWKQLLITIISCGLWLPIWLMLAFYPTKICDECNEPIWES